MSLQVGSRLGRSDVTALIGEGGIGQVYRATDTKLNRQVTRQYDRCTIQQREEPCVDYKYC